MSEIFKWYESDFLSWYQQNYPKKTAGLLNYIALYLAPEKVEELKKIEKNYTLQFIPYDWRLNDQVPIQISNKLKNLKSFRCKVSRFRSNNRSYT